MVYTEIFQRCKGLHLLGRNVFYPLRPPPRPIEQGSHDHGKS